MRHRWALVVASVVLAACSALTSLDELGGGVAAQGTIDAGDADSSATDPGDGGPDVLLDGANAGAPTAPLDLRFEDRDWVDGTFGGYLHLTPSAGAEDRYAIYWGADATTKLFPLGSGARAADVVVRVPEGSSAPVGATHLLAYGVLGDVESATPRALPIASRHATVTEWGSDVYPVDQVATTDAYLFAVGDYSATVGGESYSHPGIQRCALNGELCTLATDLTGAVAADTNGGRISVAFDSIANRVLAVWRDARDGHVYAAECTTSLACTPRDLNAQFSFPVDDGGSLNVDYDAVAQKMFITTTIGGVPVLWRCNTDTTSIACTSHSLAATRGGLDASEFATTIDKSARKLLVAFPDASRGGRLSLHRCDLDGSGCAFIDVSAGGGAGSGGSPSLALDVAGNQLFFATTDASKSSRPTLVRCAADGTGCVALELSKGATLAAGTGYGPKVVFEPTTKHLLVGTNDGDLEALLFTCDADGNECFATTTKRLGVGSLDTLVSVPSMSIVFGFFDGLSVAEFKFVP